MIEPVRLRCSARKPASQPPRYPPARNGRSAVSNAENARARKDAVQARVSPSPAARAYGPSTGRHQKQCQPSAIRAVGRM